MEAAAVTMRTIIDPPVDPGSERSGNIANISMNS